MKKTLLILSSIFLFNCQSNKSVYSSKEFKNNAKITKPYKTEILDSVNIVDFDKVETIPLTSDCNEKSKQNEAKKCVQKSISMHLARKFNANLASDLGLKSGRHTIKSNFIINKHGEIINIESNGGGSEILNNEAKRVINLLPKLIPGQMNGKSVNVKYYLPLSFYVE